jgi:hypothetical protein
LKLLRARTRDANEKNACLACLTFCTDKLEMRIAARRPSARGGPNYPNTHLICLMSAPRQIFSACEINKTKSFLLLYSAANKARDKI